MPWTEDVFRPRLGMKMGDFVHLHLHSEYSLLDGACRIKDIPRRAKDAGHDAVALTDHGVMYGVIEFYKACKREGIKPIIGCEVYVAPRSRFEKNSSVGDVNYHHLVLLCKNMEGYKNLMALSSLSFTEGFYSRPRVDKELLRKYSVGLIALSGCLSGEIPKLLLAGDDEKAQKVAAEYAEIFGEGNFYIEIQNHGLEDEKQIMLPLVRLSRATGLPLVATNDCHYLKKSDAKIQKVLTCIQTNRTLDDEKNGSIGFPTDEFYYKDTDEMKLLFSRIEGAVENTVRIAERCNLELDFDKIYLPKFNTPDASSAEEYLAHLAYSGFDNYVKSGKITFGARPEDTYKKRMEYELSVIDKMGYADYFLIVGDYVGYAKSHGIPVGPGRGSGAGSLVAYCLGITDVDPIERELLFERFLNPERVSMPDIDVDFCYNRRDEVINYVAERYGSDRVSQIITFGTLAARAAIRDTGRAMGMSYGDVDAVARAIPQSLGITIADALRLPDLKNLYNSSDNVRELVDTAMALEGMPRNASIHAAGVVITDKPVSEYVPMALCNGTPVTQYDMDTVAELGLLKFDFLALRYLTVIYDAERQVRMYDKDFSIDRVPLDDKETYDLVSKGDTSGVFQLESGGMKQMLSNLCPRCIDDIEAAIALYRPGPMDAIPDYIAAKNGTKKIEYKTPLLEPILRSTFGVTVYQEQVMSIFRTVAGYTYGHADIVRRAMSKKKADVLMAEEESFVKGAVERGVDESVAREMFSEMSSFANYAFNKSHAAAYALISYRTAYLKAHYPAAYFAALLTSVLGNQGKMAEYTEEAQKSGILTLPPDINESFMNFQSVKNGKSEAIRYGLLALKNVGESFISAIISERETNGKFTSFESFVERMGGGELNKRQVEGLIKAGTFDSLPARRSQILAVYEEMIETVARKTRANLQGQLDMFSDGTAEDDTSVAFEYPDIPEFSVREKLMLERDVSGMFFSGRLLDEYSKCLESLSVSNISSFTPDDEEGDEDTVRPTASSKIPVKIAGIITSVTQKTTKKDERMAFFTVEDSTGAVECLAFPSVLRQYSDIIKTDTAVYIDGNLSIRDDEDPKVLVTLVGKLVENANFSESAAMEKAKAKPMPEKSIPDKPKSVKMEEPKPQTAYVYNPYADNATLTPSSPQQQPPKQPSVPIATKIFLRVPSMKSTELEKAENIVNIFAGNALEVCFYSMDDKKYSKYSRRMAVSERAIAELRAILGDDNVVLR